MTPVFVTATHWFEHAPVVLVVDAVPQRNVDSVVAALAIADVFEVSRSGEKLAVLVKRARHHTICSIECLFYAISMMHIDVNIQNPRMVPKKFQNTQNNVIDVAKPTGFAFFGVV